MIAPPPTTASSIKTGSDSDSSDWDDDDDDFASRKITINIKPINQVSNNKISSSVDELRATVGTWKSLANINLVKPNSRRNQQQHHHQSTVQLDGNFIRDLPQQQQQQQPDILLPSSSTSRLPISRDSGESLKLSSSSSIGRPLTPPIKSSNGVKVLDSYNNGNGPLSNGSSHDNNNVLPTDPQRGIGLVDFGEPNQLPDILPRDFRRLTQFSGQSNDNDINNSADGYEETPYQILKPSTDQSPESSKQLDPNFSASFSNNNSLSDSRSRLPVAFAIQEYLSTTLIQGSNSPSVENLVGHIRMAVPPSLADESISPTPETEKDLEFSIDSLILCDRIQVNGNFVEKLEALDGSAILPSNPVCNKFRIKMHAVREFAKKRSHVQSGAKYYLLPELIRYYTGSGLGFDEFPFGKPSTRIQMNPIDVVSHWLCDLNVTKVRVDMALIHRTLNYSILTPDDIKNLKVSLQINGDVSSYHSRPEANWNPLESRLTWSFVSLAEFIQKSGNDGLNSCLARFDLNDGPSTPSSVSIQFSIDGRTFSGSKVTISDRNAFYLAREKHEVRTGLFQCEPPACL